LTGLVADAVLEGRKISSPTEVKEDLIAVPDVIEEAKAVETEVKLEDMGIFEASLGKEKKEEERTGF